VVTFDIDANGIVNVSAKDQGTGKEQSIKIEASSGLSDNEINRMVEDAETHASEDAERRQSIEERNQLDSLVYSTEKSLGEHKDKLDADDVSNLESAIEDAKKVLDSDDLETLKGAKETLIQASHKLAEHMYAQPGPEGAPGANGAASADGSDDDVIDAEYVDADGDKKD